METIAQTLGRNLRRLRKASRLTLKELGARTDLSQCFLHHVEKGTRWVSPETISALAKALEIRETDLFQPAEALHENGNQITIRNRRKEFQSDHDLELEILKAVGNVLGVRLSRELLSEIKKATKQHREGMN